MLKRPMPRRIAATTYMALFAAAVGSSSVDAQTLNAIERYCMSSWRNAQIAEQDWQDCTQMAFEILLERIPKERLRVAIENRESSERRELNRSVWCTSQRWRRAHQHQTLNESPVEDTRQQAAATTLEQQELAEWLQSYLEQLSPRQQEIVQLWSQGDTVAEISKKLAISPARVSDEKYKAIRKLRTMMPAASDWLAG